MEERVLYLVEYYTQSGTKKQTNSAKYVNVTTVMYHVKNYKLCCDGDKMICHNDFLQVEYFDVFHNLKYVK